MRPDRLLESVPVIGIAAALFSVPLFFHPGFIHSFVAGKELLFAGIITVVMVVLALILWDGVTFRRNVIERSWLFIGFLLLLGVSAVSNVLSGTPIVSLFGTFSRGFGFFMELYLAGFVLLVGTFLKRRDILLLLRLAFLSSFLVALYGLFQWLGFDIFFGNYNTGIFVDRIFSFLGNPSYLGQFLALNILIGLYLMVSERLSRVKIFYGFGVLVLLSALFLSGTRTAMLGLVIAGVLVVVRYRRLLVNFVLGHKKLVAFILITFLSLFSLLFSLERYSFSETAFRSLESRFELWKGAIHLFYRAPLLGHGDETFYISFPEILTKTFLTLEEQVGMSADRIHNEILEVLFTHGLIGLFAYLLFFAMVFRLFYTTDDGVVVVLCLVLIVHALQNQLSFSGTSIAVLVSFCLGSLLALQAPHEQIYFKGRSFLSVLVLGVILSGQWFLYPRYMAEWNYAKTFQPGIRGTSQSVFYHYEAARSAPFYSQLWYELMFLDASQMPLALHMIERLEGESGGLLAWKGNYYRNTNREKAGAYYLKALEKNPYHPDWIRAYADMLYKHGDYELALFMYNQFLEAIPEYWRWADTVDELSERDLRRFTTFLVHAPYLPQTIEKIENIVEELEGS